MSYLDVNPVVNTDRYIQGRQLPSARYASWDHCYNYFGTALDEGWQSELASPDHLQNSCLQLGFYLASWGMYRGKAALLKQSSRGLANVVKVAAETSASVWNIDVENYSEESIGELLKLSEKIRDALPGGATDTLVTKVMLGVYGNVPAFDRFFRKGFDSYSLGKIALKKIKSYFDEHSAEIRSIAPSTLDFDGAATNRRYTQAKVIDMVFFVEGGGLSVGN